MIQKRPYEFMTKYTPQTEWIRGSGILICMAFFTIELGGGTYIFSSLVGSLLGMIAGFLLAVSGTVFFLFHLGRPVAAIRACLRPRSSWISRGVLFISLFLVLAFMTYTGMHTILNSSKAMWQALHTQTFMQLYRS